MRSPWSVHTPFAQGIREVAGYICFGRPAGRQPAEVQAVDSDQVAVVEKAKSSSTACPRTEGRRRPLRRAVRMLAR